MPRIHALLLNRPRMLSSLEAGVGFIICVAGGQDCCPRVDFRIFRVPSSGGGNDGHILTLARLPSGTSVPLCCYLLESSEGRASVGI